MRGMLTDQAFQGEGGGGFRTLPEGGGAVNEVLAREKSIGCRESQPLITLFIKVFVTG